MDDSDQNPDSVKMKLLTKSGPGPPNHMNDSILTPIPDPLLEALLHNNEQELTSVLSKLTEEDFKRERHHEDASRNILTVACVDSDVSENIFRILFAYALKPFGHLDFMERKWYYWEPLHFAAYHSNVGKLRIIVKALSVDHAQHKDKLNVLSVLSENALHILLEHRRHLESFNVQLSNGWESRVCHVIPEEKSEIVECAKILVHAGIDINHNNIWNETPLIIAIRYRLLRVIELLLRQRDIDVDSCKDRRTGKSARDLLRETEICSKLLTPNTQTVTPTKTLFNFLKAGNEELFLRYNNENISQHVNEVDGGHETSTSGTMLQLCLIKGFILYEQEIASLKETDIHKTRMVKFFCRNGYGRSIEHLLNNGADITKTTRIFGKRNVFQMAVKLSYYPFLAILLEHRSNQLTEYHIKDILGNPALFDSRNCNTRHVLHLLTTKLETFQQASEQYHLDYDALQALNKILDFYLQNNTSTDEYRENICQVLRLGASLAPEKLEKISYETLRIHLDECINSCNDVCYNSLVKDEEGAYSETEVLHALTHDPKKRDLLDHPALIYFIHKKWLKSNKFFYANLLLYTSFLLALYFYMVFLQINEFHFPLYVTFTALLALLTLKELVQVLLYFPRYFKDISNYLEIFIIICCFLNVFSKNEMAMVSAILLSTLMFLLMLGQMPKFTKYMIIFSSTKYFLEYAMFYSIQFVSFALCFFILLPPEEGTYKHPLGEIMVKLFDSLIFFIGQYDGDITSPPKFPIFGRIIVATFIFCMTIILNNLLVGMIVTDMDSIQKTAKQQRQIKMLKYIVRIEAFLKSIERCACLRPLKKIIGNAQVFKKGDIKVIKDISRHTAGVFDDDDKAYFKEIHDTKCPPKNVLNSLYEFIVSNIYTDRRSVQDNNRDILMKLSMMEEQFRKGRVR